MKSARTILVVLAIVLLATAFAPFPGAQRTAAGSQTTVLNSPTQSFVAAALGLPLLSPLTVSASAPLVKLTVASPAVANYACKLITQTPADWTKMKGRQSFDMKWTLQNVGAKPWYKTAVDYKYISGTKMHVYKDIYDLPLGVGVGKKTDIILDMIAPKYTGSYTWYTETWGLVTGSQVFCKFSITIVVNR
jgi:hypothetical protein